MKYFMFALVGAAVAFSTQANAQSRGYNTDSRFYRATNWVEPTQKFLNSATRIAPRLTPKRLQPHVQAFSLGYQVGRLVPTERIGTAIYNRTMAPPAKTRAPARSTPRSRSNGRR